MSGQLSLSACLTHAVAHIEIHVYAPCTGWLADCHLRARRNLYANFHENLNTCNNNNTKDIQEQQQEPGQEQEQQQWQQKID